MYEISFTRNYGIVTKLARLQKEMKKVSSFWIVVSSKLSLEYVLAL
jgi:hypothetical protein